MFLETGSVLRKKGNRRPTKRTAENIEKVEQRIAETPNKFITHQLILKKDLHFFPYIYLPKFDRIAVIYGVAFCLFDFRKTERDNTELPKTQPL
jgi:hypothetical protein